MTDTLMALLNHQNPATVLVHNTHKTQVQQVGATAKTVVTHIAVVNVGTHATLRIFNSAGLMIYNSEDE